MNQFTNKFDVWHLHHSLETAIKSFLIRKCHRTKQTTKMISLFGGHGSGLVLLKSLIQRIVLSVSNQDHFLSPFVDAIQLLLILQTQRSNTVKVNQRNSTFRTKFSQNLIIRSQYLSNRWYDCFLQPYMYCRRNHSFSRPCCHHWFDIEYTGNQRTILVWVVPFSRFWSDRD